MLYKFVLSAFLVLSFQVLHAQVQLNMTFPDFSVEQKSKNILEESTDWEYAVARLFIKDKNSTFKIEFMRQDKASTKVTRRLDLAQKSEWFRKDKMDICVVNSASEGKRYLFCYLSTANAVNNSGLFLVELIGQSMETTDKIIYLKNYTKSHRESMLFLSSVGYQPTSIHFNSIMRYTLANLALHANLHRIAFAFVTRLPIVL